MNEQLHSVFTRSNGKVLTVLVGGKEYGIEILQSREVIGLMKIDAVPQMPAFMLGFINLRGHVIPVIDLRKKLGVSEASKAEERCVVIVDVQGHLTGALVDSLIGVLGLNPTEFQSDLELGNNLRADFIGGIAKHQDRMIFVLNMEKVLANDELAAVVSHAPAWGASPASPIEIS